MTTDKAAGAVPQGGRPLLSRLHECAGAHETDAGIELMPWQRERAAYTAGLLREAEAAIAERDSRIETLDRLRCEAMAGANDNYLLVKDAEAQLATLTARLGELEADALMQAIERAAKELPDGWQIHLAVECGSAWVTLEDENGKQSEPSPDYSLTLAVNESVNDALRLAALTGETK